MFTLSHGRFIMLRNILSNIGQTVGQVSKAKKLLIVGFAIVTVGTVMSLTSSSAQAAGARDCDNNSIIMCGAYTASEFTQKYNQNATGDLPALYAHYNINPANINQAKNGLAMKNGDVVVDGRVVARNARSSGRLFSGYNDGPGNSSFVAGGHTFYESPNSTNFAANSIEAFVFLDADGDFAGAIIKSCGNPIPFPPKPPKPAAACTKLTGDLLARDRVRYTAYATAVNGAKINSWYFDFGDGQKYDNNGNIIDHTYAKPGDYTAKVTIKTNIGDFTSAACSVPVKIKPPTPTPTAECTRLTAIISNRTHYSMTATTATTGGATINGYNFVIKDKSGKVVSDVNTKDATVSGDITTPGAYTAQVTAKTSVGDKTSAACTTELAIDIDHCPIPGYENLPANSPDCKQVVPVTPSVLPSTGPGQLLGLFTGVSIMGAFAHRLWIAKRK